MLVYQENDIEVPFVPLEDYCQIYTQSQAEEKHTANVNSLFPNLSMFSIGKNTKIVRQATCLNDL